MQFMPIIAKPLKLSITVNQALNQKFELERGDSEIWERHLSRRRPMGAETQGSTISTIIQ